MAFTLLMDGADVEAFRSLSQFLPLDGVTTNPSILAKNTTISAEEQLVQINEVLSSDQPLHIQPVAETVDGIRKEAEQISNAFEREVCIKVPVSKEGMKAIKHLAQDGVKITATGIFTVQQAFLAAKAGASYVAPYVNRIDIQHGNSIDVLRRIRQLFDMYGMPARILAASFKNIRQIEEAMLAGVHEVTVSPDLLEVLLNHQGTDAAVKQFTNDFHDAFGKGKTLFE
ncbi:transaldolase family protein [Bacillus sp. JCM 19041]|uniref:transaldolase family protein n=1 Tax=Bacillus sp. JCM 19041 TaxID=1460637 RepID=UPI0006D096EA